MYRCQMIVTGFANGENGPTSFLGDECLGTSGIPNTPSNEHKCRCKLLLSVTSYVRGNHSKAHAEAQVLEVAKPKSNQATPLHLLSCKSYSPDYHAHLVMSRQPYQ